jgi:ferredoxin-NADP reductase
MINLIGRDLTEYISSNTMTTINKKLNPFIWTYDLKGLVLDLKLENEDVVTIKLLPNQHWQPAKAGQYIDLYLNIDGKKYTRSYTISSIHKKQITLTIKKTEKGLVSNWLHKQLKKGMVLDISQAAGSFTYQAHAKSLFISAGSGITPCFSILNELLSKQTTVPNIQFFVQFSKQKDIIFKNQLIEWSKKINLTIALSQEDNKMKLNENHFKRLFPDFMERNIYLCGPEGFMDTVIQILEKENYNFTNLKIERFVEKQYHSTHTGLSNIYFKQFNQKIQLTHSDNNKSLLEIGLEHGLNLEKGCQRGICGSCKLILHEGNVSGNQLGSAVYICTAFPASDYLVLGA